MAKSKNCKFDFGSVSVGGKLLILKYFHPHATLVIQCNETRTTQDQNQIIKF